MNDQSSMTSLLDRLAHEYAERLRGGESPTPAEYVAKYPQLASQIQDLFSTLRMIEGIAPSGEPERAPVGCSQRPSRPPDKLGEYRVLREVGRGGMGVVYEAVQESLGRHVALKVLPLQQSARSGQLERFQREARAAAHLHHTHIVPVFAVGEDDGSHYYAMQFIQGEPLDRVLDAVRSWRHGGGEAQGSDPWPAGMLVHTLAQQLWSGEFSERAISSHATAPDAPQSVAASPDLARASARTAVSHHDRTVSDRSTSNSTPVARSANNYYRSVARLGLQAAEALAYAHEQGVLHRDIKPSNLLLDKQGTLWVTDFGLARVAGLHELTRPGDVVGTLRYVPPERFQGRTDERGDIYSLALTLYEMLALRPAFEARERAELVNHILHGPLLPLHRLDPRIPRDLETIILRGVAREPERRYANAAALAEDLQRLLDDRPIRARRIRLAERTWRWCRRNPYLAGLISTVALLLVATILILAVSQARIRQEQFVKDAALAQATVNLRTAQENHELARQAINEYLNRVTDNEELAARDELHDLRRALLEQAISFYEKLARRATHDPRDAADRADAFSRLGELHHKLGDLDAALEDFQQANTLYARLPPLGHDGARLRERQAFVVSELGLVLESLGRNEESLDQWDQALGIARQLSAQFPGKATYDLNLCVLQTGRSRTLLSLGRLDDALAACEEAIASSSRIASDAAQSRQRNSVLGAAWSQKGILLSLSGRKDEALAAFRQAAEMHRKDVATDPRRVEPRYELTTCLGNQADLLIEQWNIEEAISILRDSVQVAQDICDDYPSAAAYGLTLANNQISLGNALRGTMEFDEALSWYRKAATLVEALVSRTPSSPKFLEVLAAAYGNQGLVLDQMGKRDECQAPYQRGRSILEELVRAHPDNVKYMLDLQESYNTQGLSQLKQRQADAALPYFDRVIANVSAKLTSDTSLGGLRVPLSRAHMGRARALHLLERHNEALKSWDHAIEGSEGPQRLQYRFLRAVYLVMIGQMDRAITEVRLLARQEKLDNSVFIQFSRVCIEAVAASSDDPDRQEEYASQVVAFLRRAVKEGLPLAEYVRTSADLNPFRSRADFQQLVEEIEIKSNAPVPRSNEER